MSLSQTQDKIVVLGEVNTLVLTGGETLAVPKVSGSMGATAKVIWEVAVISVRRDSVGRSMAGVRVAVVKGGSVDVVLVGIEVDSVVMWSV